MLVSERMSTPVLTTRPDSSIFDVHEIMRTEHIRRLPVLNQKGNLVGIISETDILEASPSDATSLSIWELNYLLYQEKIGNIMTTDVITVQATTPIEEAARIMADNKIGGLPVMQQEMLVGIITETDLFKIFLELFGAREFGVRITAIIPNVPGELALLTQTIYEAGGDIIALGTCLGDIPSNRELTLKVSGIDAETLQALIQPYVIQIVDVRQPALA